MTFTTGDGEETLTLKRVGEEIKLFSEHEYGTVRRKGKRKKTVWRRIFQSPTCNVTPTIHNTDTIKVEVIAEESIDLDISMEAGPFAPGATGEADGTSEIEISVQLEQEGQTVSFVGGPGNDQFRFGTRQGVRGVNLNSQEEPLSPDVDATMALKPDPFARFPNPEWPPASARTGDGDDEVTTSGGPEFDATFGGAFTANGGAGNDTIIGVDPQFTFIKGAAGGDLIQGGPRFNVIFGGGGADTITGGPGEDDVEPGKGSDFVFVDGGRDFVAAADHMRDRINCGDRRDFATRDRKDRVHGCERRTTQVLHLKPFDH